MDKKNGVKGVNNDNKTKKELIFKKKKYDLL